ncbi:MAG: tetratricopeptide repeat protein [Verrucomicrobiota bacterium]
MKSLIKAILLSQACAIGALAQPTPQLTQNYWNSQDFIDRFMGAYGFDGDIEPSVNEEEAAVLRDTVSPLLQSGQIDAAIQQLASALTPDSSAAMDFTLGNMFYQKAQYGRARQYYRQAINKFKNFLRAYKFLAVVDVQDGRYDSAIQSFLKVIELGQGDALTYGMLGFCYMNKEQFGAAESAYRDAILLNPDELDFRNGLIQCLYEAGRYAEAITLLEDAILADPTKVQYWIMQTQALTNTKQFQRAIGNLEMIKRMGLATASTANLLGELYLNESLYDSALGAFKLALESKEKLRNIDYIRIAQTFLAIGSYSEAEEYVTSLEGTLDLDNDQKILVLNIKSDIYLDTDRRAEASEILQELIGRDPSNGPALLSLAEYNWDEMKYEQAAFYYERATKLEDFAAEAYLDFAQMRAAQKKYADAIPLLREHLRIKPSTRVTRYLENLERAAAQAAANEASS